MQPTSQLNTPTTTSSPTLTEPTGEERKLAEAIAPYKWYASPPIDILLAACMGYKEAYDDNTTWLELANRMSRSVFFACDTAWLAFEDIRPGLSCDLHGGIIGAAKAERNHLTEPTKAILDFMILNYNLKAIRGYAPTPLPKVYRWLERMGFEVCGMLPYQATWKGEPGHLTIYRYPAEKG